MILFNNSLIVFNNSLSSCSIVLWTYSIIHYNIIQYFSDLILYFSIILINISLWYYSKFLQDLFQSFSYLIVRRFSIPFIEGISRIFYDAYINTSSLWKLFHFAWKAFSTKNGCHNRSWNPNYALPNKLFCEFFIVSPKEHHKK